MKDYKLIPAEIIADLISCLETGLKYNPHENTIVIPDDVFINNLPMGITEQQLDALIVYSQQYQHAAIHAALNAFNEISKDNSENKTPLKLYFRTIKINPDVNVCVDVSP